MADNDRELLHYGKLGMRWGHHMREMAAERANRAHEETEKVRKYFDKGVKPLKRLATDVENKAKRTGKNRDVKLAKIANSKVKVATFLPNKIIGLYEGKEKKETKQLEESIKRFKKLVN